RGKIVEFLPFRFPLLHPLCALPNLSPFLRLLLLWVQLHRAANQSHMDRPDRCTREDILAILDRSAIERSSVGENGNLAVEDGLALITDMPRDSGVFHGRRARATGCQQEHEYAPPKNRRTENAASRVHSYSPGKGRDSGGDGWRPCPLRSLESVRK